MQSFKDTEGREWRISVDLGARPRIKARCGFDLLAARDEKTVLNQLFDMVAAVEILLAVLGPQMDQRQITEQQLLDSINGEALDVAYAGLLQELADFFRAPTNSHLSTGIRKGLETALSTANRVSQTIDRKSVKVLAMIDQELTKAENETIVLTKIDSET